MAADGPNRLLDESPAPFMVSYMKNPKRILAASALASLAILGACAATTSFMDKAKDFAMGTWDCSIRDYQFSVGVKPDGTALFKADESTFVSQFKWSLDGGKLNLEGFVLESGELAAASIFNVADLEQGLISNEGSPKGVESLIKGDKGSVSITKWDFDARTVSFEEKREGYRTDVASCKKASDTVTLKATTKAEQDAAAAKVQREVSDWASSVTKLVQLAAYVSAGSGKEPSDEAIMAAWKKVLSAPSSRPADGTVVFVDGEGRLQYPVSNGEMLESSLSAPHKVLFSNDRTCTSVDFTNSFDDPVIAPGAC